jgi:hypothetical protein
VRFALFNPLLAVVAFASRHDLQGRPLPLPEAA